MELRATARELVNLHQRFAPLFGRKEAQAQSLIYLNGLLLATGRKSAEPMALAFGQPQPDGVSQNQVVALQRFLTDSPWDYQDVQREIQAVFAEQLVFGYTMQGRRKFRDRVPEPGVSNGEMVFTTRPPQVDIKRLLVELAL